MFNNPQKVQSGVASPKDKAGVIQSVLAPRVGGVRASKNSGTKILDEIVGVRKDPRTLIQNSTTNTKLT